MHSLDLSVIIPVGPGDDDWRELLPLLTNLPKETEVILSACEAAPANWPEPANDCPIAECYWQMSEPGRAQQLNHGIEHCQGRMLWLLHADSRPNSSARHAITTWVDMDDDRWLYFDLAFDQQLNGRMFLNSIGANIRSALFRLPFGDQGWLLSKSLFERVGKFDRSWARGEDLEWAVRARRLNIRPERTGTQLMTSCRRYVEQGWLKTTANHLYQTMRMVHKACRQHQAAR
ncbi:MAG: hypothetical protein AAF446_03655 [Pseudomonadota bacterium]